MRNERDVELLEGRQIGKGPTADLSAALRWLREAQDFTREEVAAGAGLDPDTVTALEEGRRGPTLWELGSLLEAMDADLVGLGVVHELLRLTTLAEIHTLLGSGSLAREARESAILLRMLLELVREG